MFKLLTITVCAFSLMTYSALADNAQDDEEYNYEYTDQGSSDSTVSGDQDDTYNYEATYEDEELNKEFFEEDEENY